MTKSSKGTPLTVEYFHDEIIPTFELMMKNQRRDLRSEIKDELSQEIRTLRDEVIEYKEQVMGEIKDFREEMVVGNHQNERSTKRLDRIEKIMDLPQIDF